MSKVLVDNQYLEDIRLKDRVGNPGKEGSCYFLNQKEIVKLYHILNKRKIYFDDLSSPNISFPKDILFYYDFIAGYTMNYLMGQKIFWGFDGNLPIQDLKKMYIDIRKIISNYPDILMDDICLANILIDYDNLKINLIDTSLWYPSKNALSKNINKLDMVLNYALLNNNLFWLNKYRDKSRELFEFYRLYKLGLSVPFLEMLEAIMHDVKTKFSNNVETINDLVLIKKH